LSKSGGGRKNSGQTVWREDQPGLQLFANKPLLCSKPRLENLKLVGLDHLFPRICLCQKSENIVKSVAKPQNFVIFVEFLSLQAEKWLTRVSFEPAFVKIRKIS
jgi:hypothetical protein